MRRFLSILASGAFLISCSGGSDVLPPSEVDRVGRLQCLQGARSDIVTAGTWNMGIGFQVTDLLFLNLDSVRVIHERATKIFADARRALPRMRIRLMAEEIARNRPDVLGLQETMYLAKDDTLIAHFLDTLEADLHTLGVHDYQILSRPLNEATLHFASPTNGPDSMVMKFHEGQALLVSKRWTVVKDGIIPFRDVIPVNMLGLKTVTDRSAQWAWLRDSTGFQLEVWNTHLEILDSKIIAQTNEFLAASDSLRASMIAKGHTPSGRLFLGDINSTPGNVGDPLLAKAGWVDNWSESKWGPGYTYGSGSIRDPARKMSQRLDRILSQGSCKIDTAFLRGDVAVATDSGALFPSDHALIVSRIQYGVRP
jgi:endonuclease/exonuclease/phosphatase family metal-dependent hydrolase